MTKKRFVKLCMGKNAMTVMFTDGTKSETRMSRDSVNHFTKLVKDYGQSHGFEFSYKNLYDAMQAQIFPLEKATDMYQIKKSKILNM